MAGTAAQNRDRLRKIVNRARSIPGARYALRPYRVYQLFDFYDSNDFYAGPAKTEIVEGNGQPPKVTTETYQDLPPGSKPPDVRTVGPITPAFNGGGTDLSGWIADVDDGETRHFLLVGPDCPDGKKYRVLHITTDSALHYMVRIQSEAEMLSGMAGQFG